MPDKLTLRYGCNPHQVPASIHLGGRALPFQVLNGAPGYINMLDALNSWQLVRELRSALGLPAAASFKHVSPAGAAVATPLSDTLKRAYFVADVELSPLSTAYARARGADRLSSYGDWAALSDTVDEPTARLLSREVSDGVVAPGFSAGALAILKQKKGGRYNVVRIDPDYGPDESESRQVFGIEFEQRRNDKLIGEDLLGNVVTQNRELPDSARRDLIVATTALKYTQSNSVCFAVDGQVIGAGAGQQSRVHCTRLAAEKADRWFLRQHPKILELRSRRGIIRPERDNAIDLCFEEHLTPPELASWKDSFEQIPARMTAEQKAEWLQNLTGVALSSDAFFPFRDSIDRASRSGVRYVLQPGNSLRDDSVIQACNDYGMVMAFSGTRLFHH
jgi:phosphoribosylaminoimidazolecarboxamide formyltransferase/IMP cyclohydrolase